MIQICTLHWTSYTNNLSHSMKPCTKIIIAVAALTLAGAAITDNGSHPANYLDSDCPVCSSHRLIDCGTTITDSQKAHCMDCGYDMTIEEYVAD